MIDALLETDLLPDVLIRRVIRRIVISRLREEARGGVDAQSERFAAFARLMTAGPIAVATDAANTQHYELPPAFFEQVLGPHLKYSAAWWPPGVQSLAQAERRMLALTVERAQIADGQRILDLGCGWGPLTLFLAHSFPRCTIVAVSNSVTQRQYIESQVWSLGLDNVEVVTADINHFAPSRQFDRIVSVEMLEHVRNHAVLFERIAQWLTTDGRFFAHVFAHHRFAYAFEPRNDSDWMARHFFTGGMMPSDDLFLHHQDHLAIEQHWRIDGRHYQRTAEAWLQNLDRHRTAIEAILASAYGAPQVRRWRVRWRVFFMACAEMFGYRDGSEWIVSHYRFKKRSR